MLAGKRHHLPLRFESPEGAQPTERNGINVLGCGLVLAPNNKLCIFFTLNGTLLGKLMLEVLRINKKKSHRQYQIN
jgi:hypothetical protein